MWPASRSSLWWILGLIGVALAFRTVVAFPWRATVGALADANPWPLLFAIAVNLLSPLWKGCGWYALIRRLAPCRFWVVQEANLLGTAAGSLTVGPTGEAARIAVLVERDPVPARVALLSVAASRVTEGLALACVVLLAPSVLDLPSPLRALPLAAAAALAVLALARRTALWGRLAVRLPAAGRRLVQEVEAIGGGSRLLVPVAFGIASWVTEWVVYHLVLRATLGSVSGSASFAVLIAVNLGGILRVTPGNTGVLQAAVVAGLLPFGVPIARSVAAGVALQGVQMLPILLLSVPLLARRGGGLWSAAQVAAD